MSEGQPVSWIKRGILGCAGVMTLLFLAVTVGGALIFFQSSRGSDRAEETLSQEVPVSAGAGAAREAATAEQLADATTALELDLEPVDWQPEALEGEGVVELDLAMGSFEIVPSDSDRVEVVADYDKSRYRLAEEFTEDVDGEWRYRIRFRRRGLFSFGGNDNNKVEVRIPRGVPVSVVGEVRMGQSNLELGGLWLRKFDVEAGMGEHTVSFEEPTRAPVESFSIESQMGALRLRGIGNGSPRQLEASHRMGELRADLSGEWRNDSQVKMRFQMGQLDVQAPDDVHVDVGRSTVLMGGKSVQLSEDRVVPEGAPTLQLDLGGSMGEVRVR